MTSWELACWKVTVHQMALDQQHKIWKTQFLGLSHRNRLCRDRSVDRKNKKPLENLQLLLRSLGSCRKCLMIVVCKPTVHKIRRQRTNKRDEDAGTSYSRGLNKYFSRPHHNHMVPHIRHSTGDRNKSAMVKNLHHQTSKGIRLAVKGHEQK